MLISLYNREQVSYLKTGLELSGCAGHGAGVSMSDTHTSKNDQLELSSASQTALQSIVQALEISAGWTDMQFDMDGSITARASYNIRYAEQYETLNLSYTFRAESMGLRKEDFAAYGGKPIEMRVDFFQQSIDMINEKKLTISQTTRGAHEIIADIAHALQDVFMRKGDETVKLTLDPEAFQALMGDARTSNLLDDIAALISIINNLRLHGGARNFYHIYVSGKGKPTVDYQEEHTVKIKGSQISINITILPPEQTTDEMPQVEKTSDAAIPMPAQVS